jgi:hypothetical protein
MKSKEEDQIEIAYEVKGRGLSNTIETSNTHWIN